MSEDASIDSYMLRFCVKYWLKHINEFTIDEITKKRDLELTGLGKKASGVSDVRIDILPILKKEELIEMISEQKFRLTGEGLNYSASKIREKCLACIATESQNDSKSILTSGIIFICICLNPR
jgi:hypothetical protein